MKKNTLEGNIPIIATLAFNTMIALLLWVLMEGKSFALMLFIAHSIGLSIMGSNLLIVQSQYSQNITKIIVHSLLGLLFGVAIAAMGSQLIFAVVLSMSFVYTGLFFAVLGVLVAWLYFNRLENQEELDKIRQKLSGRESRYLRWIKAADTKGVVFLINVKDIKYFQSQDKYTHIYTQNKTYLINTSIKQLSIQLDTDYFWLVHRSTIVNLNFISKVSKDEQDKLSVYLDDETSLPISRNHHSLFKKM